MKRLTLISATIAIVGCSGSSPVPTQNTASSKFNKTTNVQDEQPSGDAQRAAMEFLSQLKSGQATADWLTVDFKKVVGEPLTPDERARGFSDSAATEWLIRVANRLQSSKLTALSGGLFEVENGTLRMLLTDSKWKVDWLHVGRPIGAASLSGNETGKRFALAAFLDPMFTNDFALTESTLSPAVRSTLAPPIGRDDGFNRGMLRIKIKGLLNAADSYSVTWNNTTAMVTLSNERKLTVTFEPLAPEKWHVKQLEMPQ